MLVNDVLKQCLSSVSNRTLRSELERKTKGVMTVQHPLVIEGFADFDYTVQLERSDSLLEFIYIHPHEVESIDLLTQALVDTPIAPLLSCGWKVLSYWVEEVGGEVEGA